MEASVTELKIEHNRSNELLRKESLNRAFCSHVLSKLQSRVIDEIFRLQSSSVAASRIRSVAKPAILRQIHGYEKRSNLDRKSLLHVVKCVK